MNARQGATGRLIWLDAIKGITIGAVVLIHLRFFLAAYTGRPPSEIEVTLNAALKSFHLPALFFASGLLIPRSLRRGPARFLLAKCDTILWPLVIWHVINRLRAGGPAALARADVLTDVSYLWFLEFLFLFCALACLSRWVPAWCLALVSLPLSALPLVTGWDEHLGYAAFFFCGMALAGRVHALASRAPSNAALAWLSLAGALAVSATATIWGIGPDWVRLIRCFAVIALLLAWAMMLPAHTRAARACAWLGRGSLALYVCHWPIGLFLGVTLRPVPGIGVLVCVATVALSLALTAARGYRPLSWTLSRPHRGGAKRR
ncbi:acyltransferase [Nanchangia anserum]|uniref:Acyltransferase n=1 Tax=Nanchangia anserum TaxID=2692125 RepID=A0A8I0GB25_9ACTO|nr:acyltransferase [Nanchangia anserum]MBD3688736.1 acyltransferase [Nanchangia anserum]QOX82479.1 acyltransferase [Nanchangia anserum]